MGKDRGDWYIPVHRLEALVDEIENYDEVSVPALHRNLIEELKAGRPHQEISTTRRIFKPDLLKFPPKKGKPPFENYQRDDVARAISRNRYALFWDMGLGKAWAKASIIAHLRHYGLAHKVLLLSTKIGSMNMVHELLKFMSIDPDEIILMHKAGKDRELFKPEKSIAITNYNTFRYIANYYYEKKNQKPRSKKKIKVPSQMRAPVIPLEEWFDGQPGILLLDESHNLGSNSSQITNRMKLHAPAFKFIYEFSGTPADKPEKLYPQFHILDPYLVHALSYQEWLAEYAYVGNQYSQWAITGWRHEKLAVMNERFVKNYGVFRKAIDVLDIPPNEIHKYHIQMSELHKQIYQSFITGTLESIKNSYGGLDAAYVVNKFPYMMLALDDPKLLLEHEDNLSPELIKLVKKFKMKDHSEKLEALHGILEEEIPEDKGIIWIYHPSTAEALQKELAKYNPLTVIGATSQDDRFDILQKFKTDPKHRILIASIKILNTSVTLVEAKFQVYFERVYSYSEYIQSVARISRTGQDVKTRTHILIYDFSMDVALDQNLESKGALNDSILSKKFLTKEEWRALFLAEGDFS